MNPTPKPRYPWRSMQRANTSIIPEELITVTMGRYSLAREAALDFLREDAAKTEIYINDIYQVQVRHMGDDVVNLCIRRRDGGPILRDWRHFQRIKNELIGEECEAVELYPAESRLVDTANKFFLFGVRDPKYRFPFGFEARDVDFAGGDAPGLRQRPL